MNDKERYLEASDLAQALLKIGTLCAMRAEHISDLLEGLSNAQGLINFQAFASMEKLDKLKHGPPKDWSSSLRGSAW
jgi:hypothetical protein